MNPWGYVDVNSPIFKKNTIKNLDKILAYYQKKYGSGNKTSVSIDKKEYSISNIFPREKKDKWFVFISSTFQDMQVERDILKNKVLPRVNDYARKYGNTVEFIDLRWGIDSSSIEEEEKRHRKVLKSCFDEIDRSRPLFIGFLGDRYGWIPPDSILDDYDSLDIRESLKGQSVTAMEIEYGMIKDRQCDALFFFRSISDKSKAKPELVKKYFEAGEAPERIKKLKEKIINNENALVKEYNAKLADDGIEPGPDFAEMVYREIIKILEKQWQDNEKVEQRPEAIEWIEQVSYMRHLSEYFVGREDLLDQLKAFVLNSNTDNNVYLLSGVSGSGKSSVVSTLAYSLKNEIPVCFVSCGRTEYTNDTNKLLRMLIWELSKTIGIDEDFNGANTFDKLRDLFFDRLWKLNDISEHSLIVVDALDQLVESGVGNELNWIVGEVPPNIKIICTSINDMKDSVRGKFNATYKLIDELSNEERRNIIHAILNRNHKELAEEVIDYLSGEQDGSGDGITPLYLSMAVNDLCMMDRNDFANMDLLKKSGLDRGTAINTYILSRIQELGNNPLDAYDGVLKHMNVKVGNGFVYSLVSVIAASRYGVNEVNIEKILKSMNIDYDSADFSWIRNYISDHMVLNNYACWDFSHSIMRRALYKYHFDEIKQINKGIVAYFENNLKDDFSQKEIIHHYFLSEEYEKAFNLILNNKNIRTNTIEGLIYELVLISEAETDIKDEFFKRFEAWVLTLSRKDMEAVSILFRENIIHEIPASVDAKDKLRIMQVIINGLTHHEEAGTSDSSLFEEIMESSSDALMKTTDDQRLFYSIFKGLGIIIGGLISAPFKMLKEVVSLTFSGRKRFVSECISAYLECAPLCFDNGNYEKGEDYITDAEEFAEWYYHRSLGIYRFRLLSLVLVKIGSLMLLTPEVKNQALEYYKFANKCNNKWYRMTHNNLALLTMAEINFYLIDQNNEYKVFSIGQFLGREFKVQKRICKKCKKEKLLYEATFLQKCAYTASIHSFKKKAISFYEIEHNLRQQIYSEKQDYESEWELIRSESDLIVESEVDPETTWNSYIDTFNRMEYLLKSHPLDVSKNIILSNFEYKFADFLLNNTNQPGKAIFVFADIVKRFGTLAKLNGMSNHIPFNDSRETAVYSLLEAYYATGENPEILEKLCDTWNDLIFKRFAAHFNPDTLKYMEERILYATKIYETIGFDDKALALLERLYKVLNETFIGTTVKLAEAIYPEFDINTVPFIYFEICRELAKRYFATGSTDKINVLITDINKNMSDTKAYFNSRMYKMLSSLNEASNTPEAFDKALAFYQISFYGISFCDANLYHFEGPTNGFIYNGDVYNGLFHGEGTLEAEGDNFSGIFDCGILKAYGTAHYSDGRCIEGHFYNMEMEGYCKIEYPSGNHYEGNTHLDRIEGKGIKVLKEDGSSYEGHFYRGKPTGYGAKKNADGSIIEEGYFRDGKLLAKHNCINVNEI